VTREIDFDKLIKDFDLVEGEDPGEQLTVDPQCFDCKHLAAGMQCPAFPDGIPIAITSNEHDHHQPFPGDHGIRFEPLASA
jgi:hypothetical protein